MQASIEARPVHPSRKGESVHLRRKKKKSRRNPGTAMFFHYHTCSANDNDMSEGAVALAQAWPAADDACAPGGPSPPAGDAAAGLLSLGLPPPIELIALLC
jgi:hypothetical protein